MMMTKQTIDMVALMTMLANNFRMINAVEISKLFGFDDGGKLLRRHLRNKFAVDHCHNQKWIWMMDDAQLNDVIQYCYDRFAVCDEYVAKYTTVKKSKKQTDK